MIRVIIIAAVIVGGTTSLLAQQLRTTREALPSSSAPPSSLHGPSFPTPGRGPDFPQTKPLLPTAPGGGIQKAPGPTLATRPSRPPLQTSMAAELGTSLKLGGGGYVTGIDIQCDNTCDNGSGTATKVVRVDTYGDYWFSPTTKNCGNEGAIGCWQQIINSSSVPTALQLENPGETECRYGYEIRIAPSNTKHFYAMWCPGFPDRNMHILSSADRGGSWRDTAYETSNTWNAVNTTFSYRVFSPFMAIDPNDENVVYVGGEPNGDVWHTDDGGSTWTDLSSVGAANAIGSLVAFSTKDGTRAGKTNDIVICRNGIGDLSLHQCGCSMDRVELNWDADRVPKSLLRSKWHYLGHQFWFWSGCWFIDLLCRRHVDSGFGRATQAAECCNRSLQWRRCLSR